MTTNSKKLAGKVALVTGGSIAEFHYAEKAWLHKQRGIGLIQARGGR